MFVHVNKDGSIFKLILKVYTSVVRFKNVVGSLDP